MPDYNKVDKWPIFDAEKANEIDAEKYRLRIDGLVEEPFEMSLEEIKALPRVVKNLRPPRISSRTRITKCCVRERFFCKNV